MGTRYNITRTDIEQKLGLKIETVRSTRGEEVYLPGEGYEDGYSPVGYREVTVEWETVAIAGWAFDSSGGKIFVGPNWGKPEIDEVLHQAGVEPDYY